MFIQRNVSIWFQSIKVLVRVTVEGQSLFVSRISIWRRFHYNTDTLMVILFIFWQCWNNRKKKMNNKWKRPLIKHADKFQNLYYVTEKWIVTRGGKIETQSSSLKTFSLVIHFHFWQMLISREVAKFRGKIIQKYTTNILVEMNFHNFICRSLGFLVITNIFKWTQFW